MRLKSIKKKKISKVLLFIVSSFIRPVVVRFVCDMSSGVDNIALCRRCKFFLCGPKNYSENGFSAISFVNI